MKRTMLCLLICSLLILPVGALMSTPVQPTKPIPPGPAYGPRPTTYFNPWSRTLSHPQSSDRESDQIIQILQEVNEDMYWMYETNLTQWGPRNTGSTACQNAAAYILNEFQNFGYDARYCPWSSGGYNSNNVEATINGTDGTSDIYIICGHYDTVSAGIGADDDTSGTVAVLMAANLLSQYNFNKTIKFVCFSGEEQGLLGSAVYAAEAAQEGWNIIGVLNCDMISYAESTNDGNNVYIIENTASEWLYTYANNVNIQYSPYIGTLTTIHYGYMWGSDHNSFYDNGYDAIFYFEYHETPYYHTSGDNLQHVNATYECKNFRSILAVLCELAGPFPRSDPPSIPVLIGPTSGGVNTSYSFNVTSTDPNGDQIYYIADWGDGTNSGWAGPYASGTTVTLSHAWTGVGTYLVKAKAKDVLGSASAWCTPQTMQIVDNFPPNAPHIDGPATMKTFEKQTYTIWAIDQQNQNVKFDVDWGDGHTAYNLGPYLSGQQVNLTHTWIKKGDYTIKARATDTLGAHSNWTYLPVTVPYHPQSILQYLLEHLQGTRLGMLLERLLERQGRLG